MYQIDLPTDNSIFSVPLPNGEILKIRLILRVEACYWTIDFIDIDDNTLLSDIPLLQCSNLTSQEKGFINKYGIFFCQDSEINIPIEDALNKKLFLMWRAKNET